VGRTREREAVLVVRPSADGGWPAEVALTLYAEGSAWVGLSDTGVLTKCHLQVRVEGRGAASRARVGRLARAV
jgi:hypothetical protein